MMDYKKLHLGCGLNTPDDWVNLDGSWNAYLAKHPILRRLIRETGLVPAEHFDIPWSPKIIVHDVRSLLPFEDDTFHFVYASHLLEHLYLEEGKKLLAECFRILQHGGVLRVVVPDLQAAIDKYISSGSDDNSSRSRADKFNDRLWMHPRQPVSGNLPYRIYSSLGNFHTHKWMYDAPSLIRRFEEAGFSDILQMGCHQSRIPEIENIEDPARLRQGEEICVEGAKPSSPTNQSLP